MCLLIRELRLGPADVSRAPVEPRRGGGDHRQRRPLAPWGLAVQPGGASPVRPGRARAGLRIPTAVFGQPALAAVGPTEAVARERHAAIEVFTRSFTPPAARPHGARGKGLPEAHRGTHERSRPRCPPSRPRGRGDHPGDRDRHPRRGHQVRVRCHARHPPTVAEEFVSLRPPNPDYIWGSL